MRVKHSRSYTKDVKYQILMPSKLTSNYYICILSFMVTADVLLISTIFLTDIKEENIVHRLAQNSLDMNLMNKIMPI